MSLIVFWWLYGSMLGCTHLWLEGCGRTAGQLKQYLLLQSSQEAEEKQKERTRFTLEKPQWPLTHTPTPEMDY